MIRLLRLLTLTLLVLLSAPAMATTVVELELDELVKLSDAIVVADVKETEAYLDEGRVFTKIVLSVREVWKGEETKEITVVHLGGRTEKLATRVHGMPTFQVGERTLVFLERPKGHPHFVVTGLSQGKFNVTTDAEGGVLAVPQADPSSIARPVKLPDGKKKLTVRPHHATPPAARPLPALRAEIDALLEKQAAGK